MSNRLKIISGNSSTVDTSCKNGENDSDRFDLKKFIKNFPLIAGEFIVIKFPKEVIESDELLENYCDNVFYLSHLGANIVIVHELTPVIEATSVGLTLSFQAHINARKIVRNLDKFDVAAVSIFADDGGMIMGAVKKQVYTDNKIKMKGIETIAEPKEINPEILFNLQSSNLVIVVSPIGFYGADERERFFDANLIAAMIAGGIDARFFVLPTNGEENKELLDSALRTLQSRGGAEVCSTRHDTKDAILDSIFMVSDSI